MHSVPHSLEQHVHSCAVCFADARVLVSVQGMAQVQQVGTDLHLAAFLCKAARHKLAASKSILGKTCFSVLSNYRRTCVTEQVG